MGEPACDEQYRALLAAALSGSPVRTRNSECRRVRNRMVTFDRTPLVTLRATAWRNCLREWEWFMSGSKWVGDLHPAVRPWWAPWADADGLVLNNYSQQFRRFRGVHGEAVDQIELLIDGVKAHPFSRRNVATTWNTADMVDPQTPITNCHGTVIQAFVEPDDSLHLTTYQRSADLVCGLPHNWLQYWAFLVWLASRTGRRVGTLTWVGGDIHIYQEHDALAAEVMAAAPLAPAPGLAYTPTSDDFRADDFALDGEYRPAVRTRAVMVV